MKTILFLIAATMIFSQATDGVFRYSASNIVDALEVSKKTGKPMLIYYTSSRCEPCQMMEKGILRDQFLIKKMNDKYLTIRVDLDEEESIPIIEKYQITILPTSQIVESSEEVRLIKEGTLSGKDFYNYLEIPFPINLDVNAYKFSSGEKVDIDLLLKPNTASAINAEYIQKKEVRTTSSDFQPGRIEVNENTYAEMKAKAVKEGVAESELNVGKDNYSKSQTVPAGKIEDGAVTATTTSEAVVKAPANTIMENEKESMYDKAQAKSKSDTEQKVKAGRLGSTETVIVKEEVVKAPASTYTENVSTNENAKTDKVNEKVAEDLIDILSDVGDSENLVSAPTEDELTRVKRMNETESAHKDERNEEAIDKISSRKVEYIQAGAFRYISNAFSLRTKLTKESKNVIVIESQNNTGDHKTLYKVLIGPVSSPDQKEELVKYLSNSGIKGFPVII